MNGNLTKHSKNILNYGFAWDAILLFVNETASWQQIDTCIRHASITLEMAVCWLFKQHQGTKKTRDKSDISYLKASWAFNIPIHSRALLAAILCWLVTL